MSIKRDEVKQKWEETEFPLVCETCLGDSSYVRMTTEPHGKKCQICETPFTVFKWQAGTKGRLKRVEICRSCAAAKNVCQVCIYDLQYGLPVKVRDKILREAGSTTGSAAASMIPQSQANRSWFTAQQERTLQQGGTLVATPNDLAAAQLREMARMEPRYERNLPKLCSFFARGECDRGDSCPFRHEMPRDRNDPLSKQSTKDRFYGTKSDVVANKILGRKRKQEQQQAQQEQQEDSYDKARASLYLRFIGDAPFPVLTEMDIRDKFYGYGEIVSIRIPSPDKGQAFVEFTQPEAAELAIAQENQQTLMGRKIFVAWARAPKRGDSEATASEAVRDSSTTSAPLRPMAPPGGRANGPANPQKKSKPSSSIRLPTNLIKVKPAPEVAAALQKKTAASASAADQRNKPYYPSADPSRLGTKAAPSST